MSNTHVVREQPWGTIDIVMQEGRVFFQQRWKYTWDLMIPMAPWTLAEQRQFHNQVDRQIWGAWSNRVRFNVAGTHPFCRQFGASGVAINFDVRWVTSDQQWDVTAIKNIGFQHSWVDFSNRKITLQANSMAPRSACTSAVPAICTAGFRTMTHEFGHTINADDEYTATSPFLADTTSIMNIGQQLRKRHLDLILSQLNTMLPHCTFSVRSIR